MECDEKSLIVCGDDMHQPTFTDILVSSGKKTTPEKNKKMEPSVSETVKEHPLYQVIYFQIFLNFLTSVYILFINFKHNYFALTLSYLSLILSKHKYYNNITTCKTH